MKTIKYLIIAAATIFTSCQDDFTDPFTGMDNYITSFSLSQGENTYMGRLEGENIILLLNEGVSLQGARATVELSENATITPDPLEIDNWLEEYQFVVISYNGSRRVYRYTPRFSNIFSDGDLTLETQADVDAFPGLGITAIEGNLIIGRSTGEDSISSTSSLYPLKKVGYDIIVNSCYKGEELYLHSLEQAGAITVNAGGNIRSVSLPALKKIEQSAKFGNLYTLDCTDLEEVGLDLSVTNASTTDCQIAFPNLEKIDGKLSIGGNFKANDFSLPKLKKATGINLTISAAKISMPELEECNDLTISNDNILAIDLPKLKTAQTATLSGTKVIRLDMPVLEEGVVKINRMSILEKLDLNSLKKSTQIYIQTSPKIKNIKLGEAEIDHIVIRDAESVQFECVGTAVGYFELYPKGQFTAVGLKEVGDLVLGAESNYEFPDLENVTGYFSMTGYPNKRYDLPKLKTVQGNFGFSYNSNTVFNSGSFDLSKLETIGGDLKLSGNGYSGFKNLDMFSPLKSAGSVTISNMKGLVSYEGLKNMILSVTSAKWSVTGNAYNPTWQDMLDGKWTNQ
jgi:hypothetical protein